jgi:hypothetical protein
MLATLKNLFKSKDKAKEKSLTYQIRDFKHLFESPDTTKKLIDNIVDL